MVSFNTYKKNDNVYRIKITMPNILLRGEGGKHEIPLLDGPSLHPYSYDIFTARLRFFPANHLPVL
jgi:hypothetical protein